jgi:hypothetical protein
MGLSEAQAEARLADLRRRRDALEREIADLVLYLELGRRLAGPAGQGDTDRSTDRNLDRGSDGDRSEDRNGPAPARPPAEPVRAPAPPPAPRAPAAFASPPPSLPPVPADAPVMRREGEPGLSETVQARRYGRALIEAALAILEEAGRPLHASEIWARLAERDFALPGADPVAALNTRLWKRSGPGGPLRRLGEAVYAPGEAEEG